MDAQELVSVYTTNDPMLAAILVNSLKDEGIAATIEGGSQAGLVGILDMRIIVKAWDADRAHAIIATHPQDPHGKAPPKVTDPRQS